MIADHLRFIHDGTESQPCVQDECGDGQAQGHGQDRVLPVQGVAALQSFGRQGRSIARDRTLFALRFHFVTACLNLT